jgi:hypothetical protein
VVETDAHTGLEVLTDRQHPLAADRRAVEVLQVKCEETEVLDDHVVREPGTLAANGKVADTEGHGLLRVRGRGAREQD